MIFCRHRAQHEESGGTGPSISTTCTPPAVAPPLAVDDAYLVPPSDTMRICSSAALRLHTLIARAGVASSADRQQPCAKTPHRPQREVGEGRLKHGY